MAEFGWPVRVYYEDTDSGGVVYHTNYLKYMERVRTEFLRARGFEQDELLHRYGIIFAVHSLTVDFLKPARFNDLLRVTARVGGHGRASVVFTQAILRDTQNTVLCRAQVKVACLDSARFRPTPIPENILVEIADDG